VEEYVEEGTLRIEWHDFPYLGQESLLAAVAARAAQEQGKFWEYHDLLYRNQSGGFSVEKLIGLAGEAGLDVERFEADLGSPDEYTQTVAVRHKRSGTLRVAARRGLRGRNRAGQERGGRGSLKWSRSPSSRRSSAGCSRS
jgi:predicted DsbA family dithiol-disulfide isomerase